MTTARRRKGSRGEAIAAAALEQSGYIILERNWRCADGELDIVAKHRGEIVFVEVRARMDGMDTALESITPRKAAKLMLLADLYLAAHPIDNMPVRIDVVAVHLGSGATDIIENAVGW
ncbi:MAG: YraN family protein [Chloroflexota bacterium]